MARSQRYHRWIPVTTLVPGEQRIIAHGFVKDGIALTPDNVDMGGDGIVDRVSGAVLLWGLSANITGNLWDATNVYVENFGVNTVTAHLSAYYWHSIERGNV